MSESSGQKDADDVWIIAIWSQSRCNEFRKNERKNSHWHNMISEKTSKIICKHLVFLFHSIFFHSVSIPTKWMPSEITWTQITVTFEMQNIQAMNVQIKNVAFCLSLKKKNSHSFFLVLFEFVYLRQFNWHPNMKK